MKARWHLLPRMSTPQPALLVHAVRVTKSVSKAILYAWPTYWTFPLGSSSGTLPCSSQHWSPSAVWLQSSQDKWKWSTATGKLEGGEGTPDQREISGDVWTESHRNCSTHDPLSVDGSPRGAFEASGLCPGNRRSMNPPWCMEPVDRDILCPAPTVLLPLPAHTGNPLCPMLDRRSAGTPAPGTMLGSTCYQLCTGCTCLRGPSVRPVQLSCTDSLVLV